MIRYEYEDAGPNARPGVQEEIKNFHRMVQQDKMQLPLLYWLLGSGTPPYKMSKYDTKYTNKSLGDSKCGNCEYLYYKPARDKYICSWIRGRIMPEGWCNKWTPAS